jgi:hypothetical protein
MSQPTQTQALQVEREEEPEMIYIHEYDENDEE